MTKAGPSTAGADAHTAEELAGEHRTADAGGAVDAFDAVLVERPSEADLAAAAHEIAAYQTAPPASQGAAVGDEAYVAATAADGPALVAKLPSTRATRTDAHSSTWPCLAITVHNSRVGHLLMMSWALTAHRTTPSNCMRCAGA